MSYSSPLYEPALTSIFSSYISDYIEQKRALHYKFNPEAFILGQFDKYCADIGLEKAAINHDLLQGWNIRRPEESVSTHHQRIRVVRAFSVFLSCKGIEAPIKFHPLPKLSNDFMPYIFQQEELTQLFEVVDAENQIVRAISPVKHFVFPALLKTTYCCGLRISEATHLKNADVDLTSGTATIVNSKNGCDRMIVFSKSLLELLKEYRAHQEIIEFGSEYFFPAPDRGFYNNSTIYNNFREYLFHAGILHGGRGKGPRVHDLRHSFAVHTLSKWQKTGKDIYVCLPILSAYMGHKNLYETQKYLRLVPAAYEELTNAYDQQFGHIFPEVN